MVIYIADQQGKVLTTAATDLQQNRVIISESMTDELASGIKTFECTLLATEKIMETAVTRNYVLAYGSLFTILESHYSSSGKTLSLRCEDAGLDLINKICPAVASTSKTLKGWIENTLGTEEASGWKYVFNIPNTSKTLEYTSESNATERILDILANYEAEMYFSYEIKGFKWIERTINFVQKRGTAEDAKRLYLNKEILSIDRTESVMNLATVWVMYGNNSTPLKKLSGYSSAAKKIEANGHTFEVSGNEVRCLDAIDEWRSKLDADGRIVQIKTSEYKKASDCINYAVREMSKIVAPEVSYDVQFLHMPDGIQCGDYVYVIDEADEIFLYARVQSITKSETQNPSAVLGDFIRVQSSMADIDYSQIEVYSIQITSSNGVNGVETLSTELTATVWYNGTAITSAAELDGSLVWFEDGIEITNTDPNTFPHVADNGFKLVTGILTESHNYKCRLED